MKRSLLYGCYQPYRALSNLHHGVFKRLVWRLVQAHWREKLGNLLAALLLRCKSLSWRTKVSVMSEIPSSPEQITGPHTPLYTARITTADKTKLNPTMNSGIPGQNQAENRALYTQLYIHTCLCPPPRSVAKVQTGRRLTGRAKPTFRWLCALRQIQRVVVFVIFTVFSPWE